MEKIAQGEFDAMRLLRYVDDIPMLAASLSRNQSPQKKDQDGVNKPVQPSTKVLKGPRMPKPKEVEKQAAEEKTPLGNINKIVHDPEHSRNKRKELKRLMRKAIEEYPERSKILGPLMNKPLESLSDAEKIQIHENTVDLKSVLNRKAQQTKGWYEATTAKAGIPGAHPQEGLKQKVEIPAPAAPKAPMPAAKATPKSMPKAKLPGWLKALGVLGGAGLAGYAGYKIYKSNQKNKTMEKKGGFVTDFLVSKLLKRKERLDKKKIKKSGSFVRSKLREM